MLITVLKRIRSLGEEREPRSAPKEVPPSVFSSDAVRIGQFTVDNVDLRCRGSICSFSRGEIPQEVASNPAMSPIEPAAKAQPLNPWRRA
jgi:hypothetical protein